MRILSTQKRDTKKGGGGESVYRLLISEEVNSKIKTIKKAQQHKKKHPVTLKHFDPPINKT